jgi:hypothetical protein
VDQILILRSAQRVSKDEDLRRRGKPNPRPHPRSSRRKSGPRSVDGIARVALAPGVCRDERPRGSLKQQA